MMRFRTTAFHAYRPTTCCRHFSCSSAGSTNGSDNCGDSLIENENTLLKPKRQRQRQRFLEFSKSINGYPQQNSANTFIPSFRDFQLQVQVRNLYRKFLRLTYTTHQQELRQQVCREFRATASKQSSPSWQIKREISEGNKRYKELQAMLSTVPLAGSRVDPKQQAEIVQWPWQHPSRDHLRRVPLHPLPKR